jgi:hypothetical protein
MNTSESERLTLHKALKPIAEQLRFDGGSWLGMNVPFSGSAIIATIGKWKLLSLKSDGYRNRVEPLLAEARGATTWRSKFGIPRPSRQLDDALRSLGRAVRAAASRTKASKLDAVHSLCREP